MQDGNIETSHGRHVWINVQWIIITTHTVQSSLTFKGLLPNCCVRCSFWWNVCSSRCPPISSCLFSSKASDAANVKRDFVLKDLCVIFILCSYTNYERSTFALVKNVNY